MRLLLATGNAHKVREIGRMLGDAFEVDGLPPGIALPPETGTTFEANALIKARAAATATGRLTLADDSGIGAEVLGGAPGVYSARYAGPQATDQENLDKLRAEVPPGTRLAYTCVVALVDPDTGTEQTFTGRCTGTMAAEPRGERGFGYDPVFLPDDTDDERTMAELTDDEKDAISHRGRALAELEAWLRANRGG